MSDTGDGRLENRRVIVTGASRGIGRAVAMRLADEGARLLLNYRDNDAAMEQVAGYCADARGRAPLVVKGDVGLAETTAAILSQAQSALGGVDVLVNNAGVSVEGLLATLKDDELELMLSTNIVGMVRLCRGVMRPMLKQRAGVVINLSSVLARSPGRGNAVYAGTKGFVESFTRAVAVEMGRKGIRVNAVAPGVVETEMSGAVRALAGESMRERIALGRFGTVDEVAALVAYLAADEASYINGAVIAVDGAIMGW